MSHRTRGAIIALVAAAALGFLMFYPRVLGFGVGLGIVLLVFILVGILDFFGALSFVNAQEKERRSSAPGPDSPPWLRFLSRFNIRILWFALALIMAGLCRVSVKGTMGADAPWSGPVLLVAGALLIVVALVKRRRPFDGELHQGFLVFALATASIMATLGSQGLWDCWETHYGEVARRQLEQDDWISLYWQNNWFFSKPILIFWMMNLGMAIFGVRVTPDEISPHAEWGVRFLVAVLAIAVICAVYQLLARRVSKRAGLFTAAILATMPMFGFMARQAITDLPLVGLMTLAVIFFLLGATTKKDAHVKPFDVPIWPGKRLRLSAFHAVVAGYVLVALPQFIYLGTRAAFFRRGSLGRGDVKDVAADMGFTDMNLSDMVSSLFGTELGGAVDISLDWFLLGLIYTIPFVVILYSLRKERTVARLCFHAMYLCLALAVMAKGLPGLAMPILGLIGFWLVHLPWRSLPRKGGIGNIVKWHLDKARRLDLLRGIPMFLLVASPWYVAMFLRHGMKFINRFFIHDHIKRLSVGVHGDNGTIQYFLQQLGYAAFPWVVLLPFALFGWMSRRHAGADMPAPEGEESGRRIRIFCASWLIMTFGLLSMMVTKFHHYVLPLVPPTAVLIGMLLDDMWTMKISWRKPVILVGMALLTLIAIDLTSPAGKGVLSGYTQLVGLFIYKYSRPYPSGEEFDISMEILVASVLFAVLLLGWIGKRTHKIATVGLMIFTLAFGHWLTQHHMVQLAPHWTQKHLFEEYYAKRKSPAERIVAFQMNWKGENFYTGNRVVVHVSTKNKNFEKWIDKHRGERHFFITEHQRYKRMSTRAKAASGALEPFEDTCNKYKAGWADEL